MTLTFIILGFAAVLLLFAARSDRRRKATRRTTDMANDARDHANLRDAETAHQRGHNRPGGW